MFADERLMKLPLHPVWKEAVEKAAPPRWAGNFRTAEYNKVLWQKMIGLLVGIFLVAIVLYTWVLISTAS